MHARELSRLLVVGRLEALSFLLLLGVAMPLKYLMDMPLATKVVGWPHGLLFLVYCYLVIEARLKPGLTAGLVLAALLPFGPFVAERGLRRASLERASQS